MEDPDERKGLDDPKRLESTEIVTVKPKKKSLVERELESTFTSKAMSPRNAGDGSSTSRYGRARRVKTNADFCDTDKAVSNVLKSPKFLVNSGNDYKSLQSVKNASPLQKNVSPPQKNVSPPQKKTSDLIPFVKLKLENEVEKIYNANISLSRFTFEESNTSTPNKTNLLPDKIPSKIYVRKDLIQSNETEKPTNVIKNMFQPSKKSNTHLNNVLERSSEKYDLSSSKSPKTTTKSPKTTNKSPKTTTKSPKTMTKPQLPIQPSDCESSKPKPQIKWVRHKAKKETSDKNKSPKTNLNLTLSPKTAEKGNSNTTQLQPNISTNPAGSQANKKKNPPSLDYILERLSLKKGLVITKSNPAKRAAAKSASIIIQKQSPASSSKLNSSINNDTKLSKSNSSINIVIKSRDDTISSKSQNKLEPIIDKHEPKASSTPILKDLSAPQSRQMRTKSRLQKLDDTLSKSLDSVCEKTTLKSNKTAGNCKVNSKQNTLSKSLDNVNVDLINITAKSSGKTKSSSKPKLLDTVKSTSSLDKTDSQKPVTQSILSAVNRRNMSQSKPQKHGQATVLAKFCETIKDSPGTKTSKFTTPKPVLNSSIKEDISATKSPKLHNKSLDKLAVVKTLDFDCSDKNKRRNTVSNKSNVAQDLLGCKKETNEPATPDLKRDLLVYNKKNRKVSKEPLEIDLPKEEVLDSNKRNKKGHEEPDYIRYKIPDFPQDMRKVKKNNRKRSKEPVQLDLSQDIPDSSKKTKKEGKESVRPDLPQHVLTEIEANCKYQVGAVAWARMGTFPFWPCIITREPGTELFVKKKLFGRIERNMIHVVFLGDKGSHSWLVETNLRPFEGRAEFEACREQFTPEDKKKDPRLYAAFFISEKKLGVWGVSVDEAETLNKAPIESRIDILYDMLWKAKMSKLKSKHPENVTERKIVRTDSDVSLSASLFETLFTENDGEDTDRKNRNSLDVSEVVTACLDNMAAKTGITKIQRQSHMDLWLQKAKSMTPEKVNVTVSVERLDDDEEGIVQCEESQNPPKEAPTAPKEQHPSSKKKRKFVPAVEILKKPYSLRKSGSAKNVPNDLDNEHNISMKGDTIVKGAGTINDKDSEKPMELDESSLNSLETNIQEIQEKVTLDEVVPPREPSVQGSNMSVTTNENSSSKLDVDLSFNNSFETNIPEFQEKVTLHEDAPKELSVQDSNEAVTNIKNSLSKIDVDLSLNSLETNIPEIQEKVMSLDEDETPKKLSVQDSNMSVTTNENSSSKLDVDQSFNSIETNIPGIKKKLTPHEGVPPKELSVQDVTNIEISLETNIPEIQDKVTLHEEVTLKELSVQDSNRDVTNIEYSSLKLDVDLSLNILETNIPEIEEKVTLDEVIPPKKLSVQDSKMSVTTNENSLLKLNVDISLNSIETNIPEIQEKKHAKELSVQDSNEHVSTTENSLLKPDVDPEVSLKKKSDDIVSRINIDDPSNMNSHEESTLQNAEHSKYDALPTFTTEKLEIQSTNVISEVNEDQSPFKLKHRKELRKKSLRSVTKITTPDKVHKNSITSPSNDTSVPKKSLRNLGDAKLCNGHSTKEAVPIEEFRTPFSSETNCNSTTEINNDLGQDEPVVKTRSRKSLTKMNQAKTRNKTLESTNKLIYVEQDQNKIFDQHNCITHIEDVESNDLIITDSTNEPLESNNNMNGNDSDKVVNENEIIPSEKIPIVLEAHKETTIISDKIFASCLEGDSPNKEGSKALYTFVEIENSEVPKLDESFSNLVESTHSNADFAGSIVHDLTESSEKLDKDNLPEEVEPLKSSVVSCLSLDESHSNSVDFFDSIPVTGDALETAEKQKAINDDDETDCEDPMSPTFTQTEDFEDTFVKAFSPSMITQDKNARTSSPTFTQTEKFNDLEIGCASPTYTQSEIFDFEKEVDKSLEDVSLKNNAKMHVEHAIPKYHKNKDSRQLKDLGVKDANLTEPTSLTSDGNFISVSSSTTGNCDKLHINKLKDRKTDVDLEKINDENSTDCETPNMSIEEPDNIECEDLLSQIDELCGDDKTEKSEKQTKSSSVDINTDKLKMCKNASVIVNRLNVTHSIADKAVVSNQSVKQKDEEFKSVTSLTNGHASDELIDFLSKKEKPSRKSSLRLSKILTNNASVIVKEQIKNNSNSPAVNKVIDGNEEEKNDCTKLKLNELKIEHAQKNKNTTLVRCDVKELPNKVLKVLCERMSHNASLIKSALTNCKTVNDSDNDSMSSELDNIALSELQRIDKKENDKSNKTLLNTQNELLSDSISVQNSDDVSELSDIERFDVPIKSLRRSRAVNRVKRQSKATIDSSPTISDSDSFDRPIASLRSRKTLITSKPENVNGYHDSKDSSPDCAIKESEIETILVQSDEESTPLSKRRVRPKKEPSNAKQEPEFLKYLELKQDSLMDEHPELKREEIVSYLYKTWMYEESLKSEQKKTDDIEQITLIKGTNNDTVPKKLKKVRHTNKDKSRVINIQKMFSQMETKCRPQRLTTIPYNYADDWSDIEDEIEMFQIFQKKTKPKLVDATSVKSESSEVSNKVEGIKPEIKDFKTESNTLTIATETDKVSKVKPGKEKVGKVKTETDKIKNETHELIDNDNTEALHDQVKVYFKQLTMPKPNVFKGLAREKVCELCERTNDLVKCKGCNGMFHVKCNVKEPKPEVTSPPTRGRKKKKTRVSKQKTEVDIDNSNIDKKNIDPNVTLDSNTSIDERVPIIVILDDFEEKATTAMKEILDKEVAYDSYSSDDGMDWENCVPGKCEIVDVVLKPRSKPVDTDNFKCLNCIEHDTPICFVCKSGTSPKGSIAVRQRCQVAHCHKYYHLECLEKWPQTQFNSGEPSRKEKKINEHFEALTCPRHVCHTCVCDDPRGCKTRFSGDKLARCVRCPATYHTFTKCLPAGTQILTGSQIICPRHYEQKSGKVPCHLNTGWCFICALGGSLICCEYCPTSFHAECLQIKPPEDGYMCEDCETGRLPLYGEIVWVKLGHYRWWPGLILHPCEIPAKLLAVKHSIGEFVVRFFGQYDHYWVNRGRVFPFQEGDSGKNTSQKSKIDEAFNLAMEHAHRAFAILKNAKPNEEESMDIQSSLLPPHYVKLKVNKPCGSLCGKKIYIEESSLSQCSCDPNEDEPCGPDSQCLNRILLTECGPNCRAGDRCKNRDFEKRNYPKMVPYRTPYRGWGLKTLEPIRAGQLVIEYVGELIDEEEFRRRMKRQHDIRDENFYFLTLDKERMIDAGPKGNLARFMNHCCEPNCETQKWTVLGDIRVGLFAIDDIPANTEVNFNYNLECTGIEKKRCMCGAKRCSGYIGAKPKQEEKEVQPKKLKPQKRPYKKKTKVSLEPIPSTSSSNAEQPVKRKRGRPRKPRELTEIEKDLLIIQNATNGISSDSEGSSKNETETKDSDSLKRKRVSFSTDELMVYDRSVSSSPVIKRIKLDEPSSSNELVENDIR